MFLSHNEPLNLSSDVIHKQATAVVPRLKGLHASVSKSYSDLLPTVSPPSTRSTCGLISMQLQCYIQVRIMISLSVINDDLYNMAIKTPRNASTYLEKGATPE